MKKTEIWVNWTEDESPQQISFKGLSAVFIGWEADAAGLHLHTYNRRMIYPWHKINYVQELKYGKSGD